MSEENPPEKSAGQRLTDERRRHDRNLEILRSEFAPSTEIDREYQGHLRRVRDILGPDEPSGIIDGRRVY